MNGKWILWVALIVLWAWWMPFDSPSAWLRTGFKGDIAKEDKQNSQPPTRNPSHPSTKLVLSEVERLRVTPPTSLTNQLPNHLSLIPTSPRWKAPFGNHNAYYNTNGKLSFPESTLPIVSILVEDEAFFDYFNGIYIRGSREWDAKKPETAWWDWPANYKNRGKEWERQAEISFLEFKDQRMFEQAGIRINGNATRAFPQKSLRLIFEEGSTKAGIENLFFPNIGNSTFVTLILRNGGNDWDRGFMRDVLVSELSADLSVETQPFTAVNVYLNGEYWGIHYLRPKIDHDFLAGKYHLNVDHISMIESPGKIYRGSDQGLELFNAVVEFAEKNDLSDSIKFMKISEQMDINSFIDYICVNMIVVNTDWPQNNWLVWRNIDTTGSHQKWKWVIKDTDYGLGFFSAEAYTFDMLKKVKTNRGPVGVLFRNLLENEAFNKQFQHRFDQMISQKWNVEAINAGIDRLQLTLKTEMPYQINRWRTHLSIDDWEKEVEQIKVFYLKRNGYLKGKRSE